jgi:nucleoside-diphosphate-sugar epimerase
MERMNVFVAGAGYVGLELCRQLAAAGHRVWAARRQPPPLPEGVTPWPCDLTDPELVVPEGVTHLAFTASPDSSDPASYERTYVIALDRTIAAFDRVAAAGGTKLERVLLVSSTSVFVASRAPSPSSSADDEVIEVDESSPVRTDGTAAHIVAGESRVLARGGVVLRLAGIYGPTRTRMIRMVRDGTARISSDRPIGNRIHRDDCAGAIAHLLAHPSPEPIYVGVDHAPVELAEVYCFLAEALGLPPPATSDEPDARARDAAIRGGTSRKRCLNTKLVTSGYTFRFPTYREGYAPLLAE